MMPPSVTIEGGPTNSICLGYEGLEVVSKISPIVIKESGLLPLVRRKLDDHQSTKDRSVHQLGRPPDSHFRYQADQADKNCCLYRSQARDSTQAGGTLIRTGKSLVSHIMN